MAAVARRVVLVMTALTAPEEVHLATARRDGSHRSPRLIWDVALGDRVFIRSTNGRGADWFRWAIATRRGQLDAGRAAYDVVPLRHSRTPRQVRRSVASGGYRR